MFPPQKALLHLSWDWADSDKEARMVQIKIQRDFAEVL